MKISYTKSDHPKLGDPDLYRGLDEINKGDYKSALEHFEKSCVYNNEYGLVLAACLYYMGFGTGRNVAKALDYCKKASSEWNNCIAQFFIGHMYRDGDGVGKSHHEAMKWFKLAAEESDWSEPQAIIGEIYLGGYGVVQNRNQAMLWNEKVALKEKPVADDDEYTFNLIGNENIRIDFSGFKNQRDLIKGEAHSAEGIVSPQKVASGYMSSRDPKYKEFAEMTFWYLISNPLLSLAHCQFVYGTMIAAKSKDQMKHFTMKAAENGHGSAQHCIGNMYETGELVKQDYLQALKWYSKAAVQDHTEALYDVGRFYYKGLGGDKKSYDMAIKCFEKVEGRAHDRADEHDDVCHILGDMYIMMGDIYQDGDKFSLKPSTRKAIKYYEKAIKAGKTIGAESIADIYYQGLGGVKEDKKKAFEWYSKAAESNHPKSQFALGQMYLNGTSWINVDLDRALYMFNKAVKGGYHAAQVEMYLVKMIKTVSSVEVAATKKDKGSSEDETGSDEGDSKGVKKKSKNKKKKKSKRKSNKKRR